MTYLNRFMLVMVVATLASCGGPKPLALDGSVKDFEKEDVLYSMDITRDPATIYEIEGKSSFTSPESSASFRYSIRMKRDSVIWLDITDPFVGLKVARALIFPDSAVMYNRFESIWMAGGSDILKESIGLDLDFHQLQAFILGEPIYIPDSDEEMTLVPDSTLIKLVVHKPITDSSWITKPHLFQYHYAPTLEFPLMVQSFEMPARNARIVYQYTEQERNIPSSFELFIVNEGVDIYFEMDHSVIRRDVDLHIPFSIPDGYERIR